MLDKGQELDWFSSKMIVWCAVISTAAFIAFIARELTTAFPIVDLRILKNRNFAVGVVMILLVGALLYATTAILPLFMQNLLNYTVACGRSRDHSSRYRRIHSDNRCRSYRRAHQQPPF